MLFRCVGFNSNDHLGIRQVRTSVFSHEQGIDSRIDFDGNDNDAIHAVILVNGRVIATGRMLEDGHIGRIAVLKQHRGEGLGSKLVSMLVKEASAKSYPRVYLGSQKQAINFYHKLGFTAIGGEYIEAGIAHQTMERALEV